MSDDDVQPVPAAPGSSPTVRLRQVLGRMPDYKPGKPATARAGVTPYKLSSNENPYGPLPSVLTTITEAAALSTGNDPGRPRHTGHTLVFGSAPKRLGQPQNSLVAVDSSQWTSRPQISSQPGAISGASAPSLAAAE